MNENGKRNSDLFGMKIRRLLSGSLIVILWLMMIPLFPGSKVNAQVADPAASEVSRQRTSLKEIWNKDPFSSESFGEMSDRVLKDVGGGDRRESYAVQVGSGGEQIVLYLEFASEAQREKAFPANGTKKIAGTHMISVFDRFADVFVASQAAEGRVKSLPGLVWYESAGAVSIPIPPEATIGQQPSRAIPDEIVRDGYKELKGKGVFVAIVDTGVDFRHPDFITYDDNGQPTSRLTYLWDPSLEYRSGRGKPAPVTYPNGVPIGTVLSRDDLTKELRAESATIPSTDRNGHGTACASIAAGNGNADFRDPKGLDRRQVKGVAPDAELIGASLDLYRTGNLGGGFLIHAIAEWLDHVAGDKPLVISNSWGGHNTGHDGASIEERHLNARFPATRGGRTLLFAAGNDGKTGLHAVVSLKTSEAEALIRLGLNEKWVNDDGKPLPVLIRGYVNSANTDFSVGPKLLAGELDVNPITDQAEFILVFPPETKVISFGDSGSGPVRLDLYLLPGEGSFSPPYVTNQGSVGAPGTMNSAITIGSYDWNDNYHAGGKEVLVTDHVCGVVRPLAVGALSCYSSIGPTRDGRMKPEVVSPGQWYASSLATGLTAGVRATWDPDTTGMYGLMNGTSAATPYAAGIVALMFEKDPSLTSGEVKDLLMRNASKDPFTSLKPGPEWGAGKLDFAAVERIMAALEK